MRKILLIIAGIDEEKLRESTKNENIIYPTLGLLMCFAALWTGLGMTYKITQGLGLNIIISISVFILIFAFALMLEMVVVGTLKSDYKIMGNLGVRIALGINLMLMQVLPILVLVFQPNINIYKAEESIKKNMEIREKEARIQNIELLYSEKERIGIRVDVAKARKENPPENRLIKTENLILIEIQNELKNKTEEVIK